MKLTARETKSPVLSPHGATWASLDSEIMFTAMGLHVGGILSMATTGVEGDMFKTLLLNYTTARKAVDQMMDEVERLDLELTAVKRRLFSG